MYVRTVNLGIIRKEYGNIHGRERRLIIEGSGMYIVRLEISYILGIIEKDVL